jgi:hypothetical protein
MMKRKSPNTSRENRLEELGRVDAERAYTKTGKRNLAAEKRRVVSELSKGRKAAVKGRPSVKTTAMPRKKTR